MSNPKDGPNRQQPRDVIKMPPTVDEGMLQQVDRANDALQAAREELGLKLWTGAEDERRSPLHDGKSAPRRR